VTEDELQGAHVAAPVDSVGGEAFSEHVRGNVCLNADFFGGGVQASDVWSVWFAGAF